MALVGKWLYEMADDHVKSTVMELAEMRLKEGGHPGSVYFLDEKVQWAFWAMAFYESGVELNIKGFKWRYINNPFAVKTYSQRYWDAAIEILNKKNGAIFQME